MHVYFLGSFCCRIFYLFRHPLSHTISTLHTRHMLISHTCRPFKSSCLVALVSGFSALVSCPFSYVVEPGWFAKPFTLGACLAQVAKCCYVSIKPYFKLLSYWQKHTSPLAEGAVEGVSRRGRCPWLTAVARPTGTAQGVDMDDTCVRCLSVVVYNANATPCSHNRLHTTHTHTNTYIICCISAHKNCKRHA